MSARIAGATAVVTLLLAAGAWAALGDLSPLGCVQDNDSGDVGCAQSADGLDSPRGLAVSPDGTSVYVAAENDDAVVWLKRDPATGAITPGGCVDDGDAGQGGDVCADSADGLNAVEVVTVSPDGRSVYAGSSLDQAVVRFDRDPVTGALTPQGCVADNDTSPETCGQTSDGLDLVFALAVSPDGNYLYAGSINDDAIVRFSRGADGTITPQACVADEDSGDPGCGQDAEGLDSVNSIAISPDGEYLYSSAGNDNSIASFDRNLGTGNLTSLGCIEDDDDGPDECMQSTDALEQAFSATLTADGSSLYAGARTENAIVRFDRNPANGALTPQGCVEDNDGGPDECAIGADGLAGVQWVRAAPDGHSLYAAGQEDDALAVLARDPATGAITPLGCVEDNDPPSGPDACTQGVDGLSLSTGLAISEDSTSLYVTGFGDDAVVALDRELTAPGGADADPPETTIEKGPKRKTKKRKAKFEFSSDEPGSTFVCKLDKRDFAPCDPSQTFRVKRRKHELQVAAVDAAGNTDPTPAKRKWKVKKRGK